MAFVKHSTCGKGHVSLLPLAAVKSYYALNNLEHPSLFSSLGVQSRGVVFLFWFGFFVFLFLGFFYHLFFRVWLCRWASLELSVWCV